MNLCLGFLYFNTLEKRSSYNLISKKIVGESKLTKHKHLLSHSFNIKVCTDQHQYKFNVYTYREKKLLL